MKKKRIIINGVLALISLLTLSSIVLMLKPLNRKIEEKSKELVEIQIDAINEYAEKKDKEFSMKTDTLIYDKYGNQIGHIYRNNYNYVNYEDISKEAIDAYIAVEDRRFEKHKGIDYIGILRAAKENFSSGDTRQGGSTITQQLIKNTIVGKEKSYKRKLKEFFIAPILEEEKGKDWVLEKYLNTNFYGNGVYGIGYAAEYYFGKKAKELTYKDTCLLIAITNGPSKYNPRTNPEETYEKANRNLKQVYESGLITKEEYEIQSQTPYELVFKKPTNTTADKLTTLATYGATLELLKKSGFELRFRFDSMQDEKEYKQKYYQAYGAMNDRIKRGGFRIYTQLDKEVYNQAQQAIEEVLSKVDNQLEASTVIIDNKTQYLLAATGGRKNDEFNRAFQALRQPGSLVKALYVYPSAMEEKFIAYGDYEEDSKIEGDYSPENVDKKYRGMVTLRDALANSINTVAYKTLNKTGINKVSKMLTRYNIASTTYPDYHNEAIALGGLHRGWSPYETAKAFASVVNGGNRSYRNLISKIEDEDGNLILDNKVTELRKPTAMPKEQKERLNGLLEELKVDHSLNMENLNKYDNTGIDAYQENVVMLPETAQAIIDAMRYTVKLPIGTAYSLNKLVKIKDEFVAKTGTTTMSRDGWGVIMTPKYTVLTWVGYDQPRPAELYGGTYPLTISSKVINKLYEKEERPKEEFILDGIVKVSVGKDGLIHYVTDNKEDDHGAIGIGSLVKRLERDRSKYLKLKEKKQKEEEEELKKEQLNSLFEDEDKKEDDILTIVSSEDMEKLKDLEKIFTKIKQFRGSLDYIKPEVLIEYRTIVLKYGITIPEKYQNMIDYLEQEGGMDEERRSF